MKFTKLDLLTLLISLFLFSSCKDSSTIGLEADPNSVVQGTLLDTVTVTSHTVADLPVTTLGIARYPLGVMNDDVFGKTTASLAMAVGIPSASYDFGTNAVIDSAVLILPYSGVASSTTDGFYGDSTAIYNVKVSQLASNLTLNTGFLNTKEYPSATQLGTFSGAIRPTTRPRIMDIVSGAVDTAITVIPQMRIKLDKDLIQAKIANLDSASLSTTAKFNIVFKGLKVDATVASGKGGMIFFDFSSAVDSTAASIAIYYKRQNATTATTIDTVLTKFQIVSGTVPVAATVKHDYSGTPVETQLANPATEYQTTYIQAMSGVRTKISFPYLKDLVSKIGSKIVISKAELVIDTSDPADSIPFKIPRRLALYKHDIAQQRVNVPDNNPYNSTTNTGGDIRTYATGIPFNGLYDYTKKSYTFTLTNYIQDLVDGKLVDYGTYLGPSSTTLFDLYPYATSAGRSIIGSFHNTDNRKIRLNIYYTKSQ